MIPITPPVRIPEPKPILEQDNKHCGNPELFKTQREADDYVMVHGGMIIKNWDGRFIVVCPQKEN